MYIGAEPNIGNYSMLDAITTSATATYNLLKGGASYTPENPLGVICSLNGVIQKAGSSFNIVNNTIVFSQALTSNDSIDFILVMGERIDLNVPADASVNNAKTNFVSTSSNAGLQIKGDGTTAGTLQLMCEQGSHGIKIKSPPHSASASYTLTMPNNDGSSGEALTTDGSGVLSWASAGGVNSPCFSARLSSGLTLSDATATDVVFQSEFFDVGSCYNASNGIFTVPSNEGGKYCISTTCTFQDGNGNISDMLLYMHSTIGGSASQEQIGRAECTSNGNLHTLLSVSYTTIIPLSAGDTIKIQAYSDTNNSSSSSLQHGARNSIFSAFKIIE